MKCDKVRDLILTDYTDGQLSKEMTTEVDAHLAQCTECREFLRTVQKGAVAPFKEIKEEMPPEFVWYRIRDKITAQSESEMKDVYAPAGFLRRLFSLPKPVYAFAVIIILLSVFVVKQRVLILKQQRQAEYVEYYASLWQNNDLSSIDNGEGYGTLIEEYFL